MYKKSEDYSDGPIPGDPSLDGLIGWLKTKEPEDRYEYTAPCSCLLHQYLKAAGLNPFSVSPTMYHLNLRDNRIDIEGKPLGDDLAEVARTTPHTFGEALERAEKIRGRKDNGLARGSISGVLEKIRPSSELVKEGCLEGVEAD